MSWLGYVLALSALVGVVVAWKVASRLARRAEFRREDRFYEEARRREQARRENVPAPLRRIADHLGGHAEASRLKGTCEGRRFGVEYPVDRAYMRDWEDVPDALRVPPTARCGLGLGETRLGRDPLHL